MGASLLTTFEFLEMLVDYVIFVIKKRINKAATSAKDDRVTRTGGLDSAASVVQSEGRASVYSGEVTEADVHLQPCMRLQAGRADRRRR